MCTLTWKMEQNSYELFFNRDELRSRSKAIEPDIYVQGGVSAIFPIDPEGSGTWIFVNDSGVSAALLNFNANLEDKLFTSRGSLLSSICFEDSMDNMINIIRTKNLKNYRGFTLCLFEQNKAPELYRWNGIELSVFSEAQPIISSSVELEEVKKNRKELYKTMLHDHGDKRETHLLFHRSHCPEKGFLSTCMHRNDAETVSFSHIICNRERVELNYKDSSPCMTADAKQIVLNR